MDMNALAKQLIRLDRYERRALSRRKAAIREFQQLLDAYPPHVRACDVLAGQNRAPALERIPYCV
jgi:hypothetical protein